MQAESLWRSATAATVHCLAATMGAADSAFVVAVPGALAAGLADGLFW